MEYSDDMPEKIIEMLEEMLRTLPKKIDKYVLSVKRCGILNKP
ncbi:MAG: hypothetical protein AABW71_04005 [Nanoarchaeota archaeon]